MRPKKSREGFIPSFTHTSTDGTKNKPILKEELAKDGPFEVITGAKANRKKRRQWEKKMLKTKRK